MKHSSKQALEQLVYTPVDKQTSGEQLTTMVMMVDETALKKYKKDKSIPLAEVVDSFDVFKYDAGRSGQLNRPSKEEKRETFGTTNDSAIAEFMLEHGSIHGQGLVNGSAGGFKHDLNRDW